MSLFGPVHKCSLPVVLISSLSALRGGEPTECEEPLDEATLEQLFLHSWWPSARPGDTRWFTLGVWECCVFVRRIPACVEWSVEPPGAATVEPEPFDGDPLTTPSVKLLVRPDVPHGTVITLRADIESGRRIVEATAHVYTEEKNPLVGIWREKLQDRCPLFVRGDVDQSGELDLTDAIRIFSYLFVGDETPHCLQSADSNLDEKVDISDGLYLLNFLFTGGPTPPDPFPDCGVHLTSNLGCDSHLACGERWLSPEQPIEELVFHADGSFSVTWTPFEVYRDYWGTYTYDLETGSIDLEVTGGNHVPQVVCLHDCTFHVEDGTLRLQNLWLGCPLDGNCALRCGHVFE